MRTIAIVQLILEYFFYYKEIYRYLFMLELKNLYHNDSLKFIVIKFFTKNYINFNVR